jgi:hypothetical protein
MIKSRTQSERSVVVVDVVLVVAVADGDHSGLDHDPLRLSRDYGDPNRQLDHGTNEPAFL